MAADLATLLRSLAAHARANDLPVSLDYTPDADSGAGDGWSLLIGDRYHYGTIDAMTEIIRGEVKK